jgi:hypothetical protein
MIFILLCTLAVALLALTASALTFLTVRRALQDLAELAFEMSEGAQASLFQHRVTRRALVQEISRVDGYHAPELTPLERRCAVETARGGTVSAAKLAVWSVGAQ